MSSQAIEIGGGEQGHLGALGGDNGADAVAPRLAGLAGIFHGLRQYGRQRGRRPIAPHGVERIEVERHEAAAGASAGTGVAFLAIDCLQPGIEAEPGIRRQVLGDPAFRRFLRNLMWDEGLGIDLMADLKRIAAVDENGGAVGEHDGKPRRAGEACQPGQPLGLAGDIFALMFIGSRHDKAVEFPLFQFFPEPCQARRRGGTRSQPVIGFGKICAPIAQRLGQNRISAGLHQLDPLGAGQSFGRCGHAAHQGIERGGLDGVSVLPQ